MGLSASEAKRVLLDEEQITINFPNAVDQRKVLARFVKFKVRSKHYRCKDCKLKDVCSIAEAYSGADDGEPRTRSVLVCSPKTPEEEFFEKEIVEKVLAAARNEEQRRALLDRIKGYSFEEIARRQNKKPEAVRKWFTRIRPKVARLLGIKFRRGRKR
jgi:DNA-directed RNA polymerase specialized sigma24 family protein